MQTPNIRAAIYARVSSSMQAAEEIPIAGQIMECEKYATARGWEIVRVYKDEGKTGKNEDRAGFQEMMRAVGMKPAQFSKIVVWRGNRIARKVENRLAFQSVLASHDVDLVSLNEPEVEGSMKVLMLPIMAAIDEYQSFIIGEDTKRGMMTLSTQGYRAGGRPPRGYKVVREAVGIKSNGEPLFRSRWVPDPEWKDRALKAFQMVAEGRSCEEIIRETGVVSNKSSLCTYFRNPCFIGELVFNVHQRHNGKVVRVPLDDPNVIHVPGAHEAIIPQELFDRVQKVLVKRRPQPGQQRNRKDGYILSGVLWCETHNCAITGYGHDGYRYYACESYRRGGRKESNCPSIKKEYIEGFVLNILKETVFTREHIKLALNDLSKTIGEEEKQYQKERSRIKEHIARLQREIDNLQNAIAQGISASALMSGIEKRHKELDDWDRQLKDLVREKETHSNVVTVDYKNVTDEVIEEIRKEMLELLSEDNPPEELKRIIRTYLSKIKIAGNSLRCDFNLKDLPAVSQVMVAGVVLRYLAKVPFNFPLPSYVFAKLKISIPQNAR